MKEKTLEMLNGATSPQIQIVHVDDLEIDPRTPDPKGREPVDDLVASIEAEGGLLQFIFAIELAGRLYIISGGRRLRAARLMGYRYVPVILVCIRDIDVPRFITGSNAHRWKTWHQVVTNYWALNDYFEKLKEVDPSVTGRLRPWAANELGVGESTLHKALRIYREEPELLDAVDQGLITLNQAHEKLKSEKAKKPKPPKPPAPPMPIPRQSPAKPEAKKWKSPYEEFFDEEPQDEQQHDEQPLENAEPVYASTSQALILVQPSPGPKASPGRLTKLLDALLRWWRWFIGCIFGWIQKPAKRGQRPILPDDSPAQLAGGTDMGGHPDLGGKEAA